MKKTNFFNLGFIAKIFFFSLFIYLFMGFMVIPCINTLASIFTTRNATGLPEPWAVIKFFLAGTMPLFVWNSLKLAVCLVITVNIVGISIVLLTEYFDIKGANILRMGYMTTLIYSGVALVTSYQFLYDGNGIITTWLSQVFPLMNKQWFSGFNAVLFTMTFACTSNHALFLRSAIRGIDYSTVEAARNLGASPFNVLLKVVMPALLPTLFSLTVMTFIAGLCAISAPTLLGYNSISPEIVRLAGSSAVDEAFPQARAALLSVILAMFTIILLSVLNHYERKGHYLSISKNKAKLVRQKINNPFWNIAAHVYAYILFVIYITPVIMIVLFSFQNYQAIRSKMLDFSDWTLINYISSGLFSNSEAVGAIRLSFMMSAVAAALACVIVVIAVSYIFRHKNKMLAFAAESCLLFPCFLPAILICCSYRIFFNREVWYVFGNNLYWRENVKFLIIMAYTVTKLPFTLKIIKAAFYAIDDELEEAAKNLGASPIYTFMKVKLPIILPSVLAAFALNFNALFGEYGMGAIFQSSYGKTYAMLIQNITTEEGLRCAATVFIMILSGIILYFVYVVGSRDLGEKLEALKHRHNFSQRINKAD